MLNIKTAAAALLMIVGATSFATAATATRADHDRGNRNVTNSQMYEGRSAYVSPAFDSQQPVPNSQAGLNGADNAPAH